MRHLPSLLFIYPGLQALSGSDKREVVTKVKLSHKHVIPSISARGELGNSVENSSLSIDGSDLLVVVVVCTILVVLVVVLVDPLVDSIVVVVVLLSVEVVVSGTI